MFKLSKQKFDNAKDEAGVASMEVVGEKLFVPLKKTHIRGKVAGPFADVSIVHEFGFSKEDHDAVIEAIYRFPMSGDSTIKRVVVKFGAVEIETELREREKAEEEYKEAKATGKQAAIMTKEAPDVFTLRIAGIKPDEDVIVTTDYVQNARIDGIGWSLRVPLTQGIRFSRTDEKKTRRAQSNPMLVVKDPQHRFDVDLSFENVAHVSCPSHIVKDDWTEMAKDVSTCHITLDEEIPNKDFVINWLPPAGDKSIKFYYHRFIDPGSNKKFFMQMAVPPEKPVEESLLPRRIVFLIDHSGSMSGKKENAADRSVKKFIGGLHDQDYFALGAFHNHAVWMGGKPQLMPAATATEKKIDDFLGGTGSGGTELGTALEEALGIDVNTGTANHVIVITDAQVSDFSRICRLAEKEYRGDWRISVICIDAAPNSALVNRLADLGGGVAKFLRESSTDRDIEVVIKEILSEWSAPYYTDAKIIFSGPSGAKKTFELGDLSSSRTVWAVGWVPKDYDSFETVGSAVEKTLTITRGTDAPDPVGAQAAGLVTHEFPALKMIVGADIVNRLEHLAYSDYTQDEFKKMMSTIKEDLVAIGIDEAEVEGVSTKRKKTVYADNALQRDMGFLKQLIVKASLAYGVISEETAFIAVRKEAGEKVTESVVVPSALPEGWDTSFLTSRVGAAGPVSVNFAASAPTMHARSMSVTYGATASLGRSHSLFESSTGDAIIGHSLTSDYTCRTRGSSSGGGSSVRRLYRLRGTGQSMGSPHKGYTRRSGAPRKSTETATLNAGQSEIVCYVTGQVNGIAIEGVSFIDQDADVEILINGVRVCGLVPIRLFLGGIAVPGTYFTAYAPVTIRFVGPDGSARPVRGPVTITFYM